MKRVVLRVQSGQHHRKKAPIFADLPADLTERWQAARIVDSQEREVYSQTELVGDGIMRVHWILAELSAEEEAAYTLDFAGDPPSENVRLILADTERVEVEIFSDFFTAYNYSEEYPKPFLFPLLGPGGAKMTRSFPMGRNIPGETTDHPHHRSVFTAHGDVNGRNFWAEEEGHGWQLDKEFKKVKGGPVFGEIHAVNNWQDGGRPLLQEERMMRFYALTEPHRIIDYSVKFTAAQDVVFGDTKEAGIIAVRVATPMDVTRGGAIENSFGGRGERECWGKRAFWCDYSGISDGEKVGIAVMDHPDSFRYPTWWHVRNYGLLAANPFGWKAFYGDESRDGSVKLGKGESLFFSYRLLLHLGDARMAKVRDRYVDFAAPPVVQVEL